jgi:hypothetical protein
MAAPADGSGPLIAVMNSSRDLVTLLQTALEQDGFRTISLVSTLIGGASSPLAFLREHEPAAAVYSVSPPYQEGWAILEEVRQRWQGGASSSPRRTPARCGPSSARPMRSSSSASLLTST